MTGLSKTLSFSYKWHEYAILLATFGHFWFFVFRKFIILLC